MAGWATTNAPAAVFDDAVCPLTSLDASWDLQYVALSAASHEAYGIPPLAGQMERIPAFEQCCMQPWREENGASGFSL